MSKKGKSEPVRAKMHEGLRRKHLTRGTAIRNVISGNVGWVQRRPNSWVVFVRVHGHSKITPWSLRNVRLRNYFSPL